MKVATNQERLNELFDKDPRTDSAIADALGVSKQTISMWRHGTRSPKKQMLIKIAELYNVSIEWLMGFDDNKDPRYIVVSNAELFQKLLLGMKPLDYEVVMEILERTETEMRARGEL